MTPTDRRYTKDHEWVMVTGATAKVGITDHAQDALGDIVYVELPEVGAEYEAGASFAVVESVKAASEIFTPVGGKVVAVNDELDGEPEKINGDPYGAFIAEFEVSAINEAELMDAAAYDEFVASEE